MALEELNICGVFSRCDQRRQPAFSHTEEKIFCGASNYYCSCVCVFICVSVMYSSGVPVQTVCKFGGSECKNHWRCINLSVNIWSLLLRGVWQIQDRKTLLEISSCVALCSWGGRRIIERRTTARLTACQQMERDRLIDGKMKERGEGFKETIGGGAQEKNVCGN